MRILSSSAIATLLLAAMMQPAHAVETLQGKYLYPTVQSDSQSPAVADVEALRALQDIRNPLNANITFSEYAESLRRAKLALDLAVDVPNARGIEQLQSAMRTHILALQFWHECLLVRNDFLCDEKRPAVAEVLRRYPKPVKIETIALRSPIEAISRYPKPWILTRVRATLREVVEYVPYLEQRKALILLWNQAAADTENAANAIAR